MKPRILLLVDRPGWAYDTAARALQRELAEHFTISIAYVVDRPDLRKLEFDLLHVFFWGETWHLQFRIPKEKVFKEVSSHRWQEAEYGCLAPDEFVLRQLGDAGHLGATSLRLQRLLAPLRPIGWIPNGFDSHSHFTIEREGPLRIGWAGNRRDPCKGLTDVLLPACGTDFTLAIAGGERDRAGMADFYRSIDVLCVASTHEGEPLTLVEGMASGCFPVAVDVGIVPELVRHGRDGLIVNRTPAAFRAAFQWCTDNLATVRAAGRSNAQGMAKKRTWAVVAPRWQQAWSAALASARPLTVAEQNFGERLLEWPARAQAAAALVSELPWNPGDRLVDLGCGKQTLRALIPAELRYVPVDRVSRSADTIVIDLGVERPAGDFPLGVALGLLEYLPDLRGFLAWLCAHVDHAVLSFNDCSDVERATRQHWKSRASLVEFERLLAELGAEVRATKELSATERVYAFSTGRGRTFAVPSGSEPASEPKLIALFSAAVHGDNSGDALIEDAVRRLLPGNTFVRVPLVTAPNERELEQVDACDVGIVCGTNLYQHTFACGLDEATLKRIRIPLVPLGIGASAAIGSVPRMDKASARAVRALHDRCQVASVRDPLSAEFVRSLGIKNVELTGCPVLFHGIAEPEFVDAGTELQVSIRERLLHVPAELGAKQRATLTRLCRERRPTLVVQSPYDLPLAFELAARHGVRVVCDPGFQAGALVDAVRVCKRTLGFRLHYGMLALSWGRPATFLATDTRVTEFCRMMGLPWHEVATYEDAELVDELARPAPDMAAFTRRWRALRDTMVAVLHANGLRTALAQPEVVA